MGRVCGAVFGKHHRPQPILSPLNPHSSHGQWHDSRIQPPNLTLAWPQAAGSRRGQQVPRELVLELIPHTKTHTPRRGTVCPRHPAAVMGRDWTTAVDPCVGTSRMSVFGHREVHLWAGIGPCGLGVASVQSTGRALVRALPQKSWCGRWSLKAIQRQDSVFLGDLSLSSTPAFNRLDEPPCIGGGESALPKSTDLNVSPL